MDKQAAQNSYANTHTPWHGVKHSSTVAALHQGAPGHLEDPPPSPLLRFGNVWTEYKNVAISDRFICFILTVKRRLRPVFWGRQEKVHPGDLAVWFADLEMTWLLYCAGAATAHVKNLSQFVSRLLLFAATWYLSSYK